ncbi:MAG: hypothetical protein HYW07_10375 [Candidatus Latescibacteria bacterium]|nr:hypothetical protein [Candidatus Latescibacterota bacterium]
MLRTICMALLLGATALEASPIRVLSAGEQGLLLEAILPQPQVRALELGGHRFHQLELPPGYDRLAEPGQPALPFLAAPIAVPPGVQVRVEVEEAHWRRLSDLELAPAPRWAEDGEEPRYETDTQYYLTDAFEPAQPFAVAEGGRLRGVRTCMLQLYPFRYNPVRRELEFCDRLRVRVEFVGGRRPKAARVPDTPAAAPLYRALLNPQQAQAWREGPRAPKLAAGSEWYDPGRPWVKVYADEDALFRSSPGWLDSLGVDPKAIDPRTLRLFYLGEEQAIRVHGEEDGRFDAQDYLLFFGQYRRDEHKDFENLYGRRNTYWLTWGGAPGRRLQERSGAPAHGYPVSPWKWTTAHFEQDTRYNPLPLTPPEKEQEVDHWFWELPVEVLKPGDVPSSRIYAQPLLHRTESEDYTARLRVALHGVSDNIHHTGLLLNEQRIDERVWRGPDELRIETEIPSSYLKDQNRLRLQLFADQSVPDQVYLNWFEIEYRRAYQTWIGFFDFAQPPGGQSYVLQGLYPPGIEVWDVANGYYFTGFQADSTAALGSFVTFEDNPVDSARYVAADSLAGTKRPNGKVDQPSSWRAPGHGADYLIITHADFLEAAQRLVAHRRESGLSAEVVEVEDLYDEFSCGQMTSDAVRDFISYAYHSWERPPVYVLLAGNTHYAYRSSRPSFVPTLFYHAWNRGQAGTDFLYSLVDGADLLPDLAVGRLSWVNLDQALVSVDKIIRYDQAPEPGDWRSRVIYLANYQETGEFARTNDELAAQYTEPLGFSSVEIVNPDNTFLPNLTGKRFLDALNQGALLVNFNGHGSIGTMQYVFSIQFPDWDYLSQVRNGARLPLVLALSCLNGQFADPFNPSLSEAFTLRKEGGSIAYISASAQGRVAQQALLADRLFAQFFQGGTLEFGLTLNIAKVQMLAAHSSFEEAAYSMQLQGDPAQQLALPRQPDYEALDLRLDREEVFSQDTLRVEARWRNNTRLGSDSVQVALLVRSAQEEAPPETLLYQQEAPFAGTLTLAVDWPVGQHLGPYEFELQADPAGAVSETDESNNQLRRQVEVHSPVIPGLLFPLPGAVLLAEGLALEALLPLSGGPFSCEFALSADPAFAAQGHSDLATPAQGKAVYQPQGLQAGQGYFWRARARSGAGLGPWSEIRSFWIEAGASPPRWRQRGAQLLAGESLDLELAGEGMVISAATRPLHPAADTREAGVAVEGLEGAGVVCADGTYLYAKRWFNDKSTVYPGTDFFTRIGSGFNGTQFGQVYGVLADSTTGGISATCHSDGYLYSEMGDPYSLERISTTTGRKDTVTVPEGLLEWKSGQIISGHALITSDGRYLYNVSMSSEAGTRSQWRVRVFDPASDWALLRDFTSPPTEPGFTYTWTDGILADGERLYFIEYQDGRRIRMVDGGDGRFLDEWQSDQDSTRIISGQYDWVNNKVWLGDLWGPGIFRYQGVGRITRGQLLSQAVGPASSWKSLLVQGQGVEVEVLGRQSAGASWQPLQDLKVAAASQPLDLGGVDAAHYPQLRLRARLQGSEAHLDTWALDFAPLPSLGLERALLDSAGRVEVVVRNLGVVETGARLRLEQGERRTQVRELTLAPLQRGEARQVLVDSLASPPGTRLFVRLLMAQADADPQDDVLEVSLQEGGRAALGFRAWPGGQPLFDGDPLVGGEGVVVQAGGEGHLALAVDGVPVQPDSVWEGAAPGVLYRPSLKAGEHRLQARLLRGGREAGFAELRFRLSEELVIANALPYPQPMREGTTFTYALSHEAQVAVEIYALSGRRVLRLGPLAQGAGFQQVEWDGRDQEGRRLANGAYLYRISAEGPQGYAEFRGALSVVR